MASQYAPERVVKGYFSKYDKDGSGLLNAKEFSKVCYDMGLFLEPVEVEAAMHLVDTAKDGSICFNEFWKWWQHPDRVKMLETADNPTVQAAIQYFQKYDTDNGGSINVTEFTQLCKDLGWSTENISRSMSSLDKNQDGVIDFNEFLIWLRWDIAPKTT